MFGIIGPVDTPLLKRRPHQKSRTGCITCKERKLKCDEIKPVCGNCNRRFVSLRVCDYGTLPKRDVAVRIVAPKPPAEDAGGEQISRSSSPMLLESVAGGILDPFASYPETKFRNADVDVLLKYYLTKAVYRSYPWQPPSTTNPTTTYYVPLVFSDPVLFHAILQLTCLRLDKEKKYEAVTRNEAQMMVETINLLRLRVEEENGVSDQTIGAVATMAAIEHERGNTAHLRMHMSGLKRMITIRGGLENIRASNPMVANLVIWISVVAIYETPFGNLDLILSPFFPCQHNLISSFSDLSPQPPNPPPLSPVLTHLTPSIHNILISVQHVSQLVPSSDAYPTAAASLVILTRMMALLSHLMSLPPITEPDDYSRLISESGRYAVLLHVFTPWRGLPPDGTLAINNLLHRLISFLQPLLHLSQPVMEKEEGQEQSHIVLFWIVAVGGVSAHGMPERTWFVGRLGELCEKMSVACWEDWRGIVSRVVWHEMLCSQLHKKLWGEVQKHVGQKNANEQSGAYSEEQR